MSGWRAIVPFRGTSSAKSRLAPHLSPDLRRTLAERMAIHVLSTLAQIIAIEDILLISAGKPAASFARLSWLEDSGLGLNKEIARGFDRDRVLVVHADLPFLTSPDIVKMLGAAESTRAAIAPDTVEKGTNALALLCPQGFEPQFGVDSFARHRLALPDATVVRTDGLAQDIDTPIDLELLKEQASLPLP